VIELAAIASAGIRVEAITRINALQSYPRNPQSQFGRAAVARERAAEYRRAGSSHVGASQNDQIRIIAASISLRNN